MQFRTLSVVSLCLCLVGCQTNSNSTSLANQNESQLITQPTSLIKPHDLSENTPEQEQGTNAPQTLAKCLVAAGTTYHIPPAVLIGIMHVEGGAIGKETPPDKNGNYKIGVMNINSVILPKLAEELGMSIDSAHQKILNDGCANIRVAAWILSRKAQKAKTLIGGIAMYPSVTDTQNNAYADQVIATLKEKGLIKGNLDTPSITDEKDNPKSTKVTPTVCGDMDDFFFVNNRPVKKCKYKSGRNLVAKQVTRTGILASLYGMPAGYDKVIFLFKGNGRDNDLADGDIIDSGTFEYMGPYSYQSLLGQRTVHSFRRLK